MKRSTMRAFGIGVFLAGVIAFAYEQLPTVPEVTAVKQVAPTTTEAKPKPAKPKVEEPKSTEQPKEQSKEQLEEQQPTGEVIYQLKIYSGATPASIAADLQTAGIIANKEDAEILLSTEQFARSIQVGVYNITDSMTLEDIAIAITK